MDTSPARRQAQRLLSIADLEPASMPKSAVLIVRHIDDPAPRELMNRQDAILPAASWLRAARSALADCFDRAARPIDGPVPPSANAVRFDDESQLLACLARDYLAGDAPARWWWRALFRDASHDALATLVSAWLQRPRAIPAAIACLASNGASTPFVGALSSGQVRSLFVAVAGAFDLPALVAAAMEPLPPIDPPRSTATEPAKSDGARASLESVATPIETEHEELPPWHRVIEPIVVPAALDVERHALVGVALALWRSPLTVRTHRFAQAFRAWRLAIHRGAARDAARGTSAAVLSPPPRIDAARDEDSISPIARASSQMDDAMPAAAYVEPAVNSAQAVQPIASIRTPADPVDHASGRLADRIAHSGVAPLDSAAHSHHDEEKGPPAAPIAVRKAGDEPGDRDTSLVPAFDDAHDPRSPVEPVSGLRRERPIVTTPVTEATTDLGGLLFLINALDDERLWERFAEAQDPESPFGGWSWLAFVARRLLGTRADGDLDPIWRAFAALDGRDAVAPDAPPLLDIVVPPLRERLLGALEIDDASVDAEALLAQRLLFRRGHLRWDATHVDLHMAMAQIDIAVRLAGLDANPGWVPALGRVVTFYFTPSLQLQALSATDD